LIWCFESVFVFVGCSATQGHPPTHTPIPRASPKKKTHYSLVAFFKELPVVLAKLRPVLSESFPQPPEGGSIEDALRLREWQETLVSLTILAKKYKDLFWRLQPPQQRGGAAAAAAPPRMQAGWLLFLLLKAQLLQQFPDLVRWVVFFLCVC
jgi:hypothetical protein